MSSVLNTFYKYGSMVNGNQKWGYLRETKEDAEKAGIDPDTGIKRTGLEEYLEVIFPDVTWVHDRQIEDLPKGTKKRYRPDYRSGSQKIIIEFDGIQHYKDPLSILKDAEKDKFYKELGYKVVRIPYFIQLTNSVVETMFGIKVKETLFQEGIPSMGPKGENTPAFLCHAGIERMAEEFRKYPEQYEANISFLKECNDEFLTGVSLLERAFYKE